MGGAASVPDKKYNAPALNADDTFLTTGETNILYHDCKT